MMAGQPAWAVAGYLGMSVEMVSKAYAHHSPCGLSTRHRQRVLGAL